MNPNNKNAREGRPCQALGTVAAEETIELMGDKDPRDLQAEQMDGRMGEHHYGQERRESAEQKAERLVREGPKKARWTEEICRCGAKLMR